tara:strand:- start:619 stop:1035 length:417 start_codon:yes stop_codon:yes gene_type:complete
MKYTLITGASKGMGLEMAHVCAAKKMNLLLVSLPNEGLEKISIDIANEYNVKTDFFETNLSINENIDKVYEWVMHHNYLVNFLINNAGIGGMGLFESYSPEYINNTIDINVRATTKLSYCFIPELKKTLLHSCLIMPV